MTYNNKKYDTLHYCTSHHNIMMEMQICVYTNINKNMVTQTLKQEITQLEANFCAGLSDSNRLLILYALNEKPLNVTDLANELGLSQPTMSRHLKILRERGLVYTIRTGTVITYHLSDPRLIQALDLLRNVMRERLTHQANLINEISQENV
jgi:DNA-binding transcriptional ArsR family regulator